MSSPIVLNMFESTYNLNYHDVYYKLVVVLMMRYRQSNKTWGRILRTMSWLIIRNDFWVCKWCQCLAIYYWL